MSVPTGTPGHDDERRRRFGDVQAAYAATLVDEWARTGIEHAVVCPGSRSTPLAVALAAHGGMAVHVRLDERSAGFMALGIGHGHGPAGRRPHHQWHGRGRAAPGRGRSRPGRHPPAGLHGRSPAGAAPGRGAPDDRPGPLVRLVGPVVLRSGGGRRGHLGHLAVAGRPGRWPRRCPAPEAPGPVHLNLPFREPLLPSSVSTPTALPGRPGAVPWHTGWRWHRPAARRADRSSGGVRAARSRLARRDRRGVRLRRPDHRARPCRRPRLAGARRPALRAAHDGGCRRGRRRRHPALGTRSPDGTSPRWSCVSALRGCPRWSTSGWPTWAGPGRRSSWSTRGGAGSIRSERWPPSSCEPIRRPCVAP